MRVISVTAQGQIEDTTYTVLPQDFTLHVTDHKGRYPFDVKLHPVKRPEWQYRQPDKVFVMSDPHGKLNCVMSLLRGNNVIDKDYHWSFGTNHLVVIGDIFDRGKDVPQIFWLFYKLEQAADAGDFKDAVTEFYGEFGVGKLGLHKAFRVLHKEDGAQIVPITNIAHVKLDDLVGYEIAKQKLIDNTESFVRGKEANNCLLYGDAGTGKSTSIKAIANQYYDRGLRLIEVYKHQFCDLNDVIAQIKNRNYKFIIYMDDLSFEEFEIEYKYLKAVIEGGLEKKPDNVLIYATSNRRHLIRETFSDKEEVREDMHTSDTVQEKLSLYARFGVSIYFGAPGKKEFQHIVVSLAEKNGITMDEETLLAEANKWELAHGGLSGRTAQQFINYLLGKQE